MALILDSYGAALLAFVLFALLHSLGAHEPLKQALARWSSPFWVDHFWRLVYCSLSFGALYGGVSTLLWGRHSDGDVWLLNYPDWLWQTLTALLLASIGLVYAAFLQSDYQDFLGLAQAWRGLRLLARRAPTPAPVQLFGSQRLVTTGVYAWVRHPMLAGGLLFLLTSGPSLNNLVYTLMYTGYMLIGGYYEERRLVRIFGDDYRRYRRRVGAFCPRFRRRQTFT